MSTVRGDLVGTDYPPEARRAVAALERGDWLLAWRRAALLQGFGTPVALTSAGMRDKAFGLAGESWQNLVRTANSCRSSGRPVVRSRDPGDRTVLPWPAETSEDVWGRLVAVGQREEAAARAQWLRIEAADYPKRAALVEAFVDHLIWVAYDPQTWHHPRLEERLPSNDRVMCGQLGHAGREYFVRRANELLHAVDPYAGSLTRTVWDDLGRYQGVRTQALAVLASLQEQPLRAGQRISYTRAVENARLWLNP